MIPIHTSVRGIGIASLVIIGFGIYQVLNHSKAKADFTRSTGTIEYFDKEFQDLPHRHEGDYRYLKIDTYAYLFEIYEPHSESTAHHIDELREGDRIDIYFYETDHTRESQLNRFTQFIDKAGQAYFIRNGFQMNLGLVIIGLGLGLNVMSYFLWRKGKLEW